MATMLEHAWRSLDPFIAWNYLTQELTQAVDNTLNLDRAPHLRWTLMTAPGVIETGLQAWYLMLHPTGQPRVMARTPYENIDIAALFYVSRHRVLGLRSQIVLYRLTGSLSWNNRTQSFEQHRTPWHELSPHDVSDAKHPAKTRQHYDEP